MTLIILLVGSALGVQKPDVEISTKPQWQRMLGGDDLTLAQNLQARFDESAGAGKFDEAIQIGEQLLRLRQERQGRDHWETVGVSWSLAAVRRANELEEPIRSEFLNATRGEPPLLEEARGRAAELEKVRRETLGWNLRVFGDDHPHTAMARFKLGVNLEYQGRVREAEREFENTTEILHRRLGEWHPFTSAARLKLASSLEKQGRYAEALALYVKNVAACREVLGGNSLEDSRVLGNLASNLLAQGRSAEARMLFEQALAIRRRILGDHHPETAVIEYGLANVFDSQGKDVEAKRLFETVAEIWGKHWGDEHPDTARARLKLGATLLRLGSPDEARPLFEKNVDVLARRLGAGHPDLAVGYACLSMNLRAVGKLAEARRYFEQALALSREQFGDDHPRTAACLANLAEVLAEEGNEALAQQLLEKALQIRRAILGEYHPDTARSYYLLGVSLRARGAEEKAVSTLKRAVDSYEASRLAGAVGADRAVARLPNPRLLLAHLLAERHPGEAWSEVEHALARGTLDQIAQSGDDHLTAADRRERDVLEKRLLGIYAELAALAEVKRPAGEQENRRNKLLAERTAADEALTRLAVRASARTVAPLEAVQAALDADEAIVGWVEVSEQAGRRYRPWAYAVRQSGAPRWELLAGTGQGGSWIDVDAELCRRFRQVVSRASSRPGECRELAAQLFQQRIAPLQRHLAGVRKLCVIPAGAMAGVPVEALTDQYTVSYTHSATLAVRWRNLAAPAGRSMLAVGNPIFEVPEGDAAQNRAEFPWKELPATAFEIERIRSLSPHPVTILSRKDATEQNLDRLREAGQLGGFRYLHFATHGETDLGRAFESALILSQLQRTGPDLLTPGAPTLDGRLSAREVLEFWKLDAELATLSACESGLGRQGGGDGLLGFTQAFLTAGARSVCLSLWKVDDTATALLMNRFYENLLGKREGMPGPLPKAEALAEAKHWLRNLSLGDANQIAAEISRSTRTSRAKDAPALRVAESRAPAEDRRDAKPFAHPAYWAAFVLFGDAN